jgi:hypothetical protein
MSFKHVDTLTGKGLLQLADRPVPVDYEINVFQGFDGDVPTLKSARGRRMVMNELLSLVHFTSAARRFLPAAPAA